jgi:hypothetical protein
MVSNKTKTDQCAHVRDGSADIHQGDSYVSFGGGGLFVFIPNFLRMKEDHRSAGLTH